MAPLNLSSPKSRGFHSRTILGPELYARLPDMKVLIVGAGGIGCELRMCILFPQNALPYNRRSYLTVKNVVLVGFGQITLLDLDTIDLSNLNRQFLFRKKDVKQSKALVRRSSPLCFVFWCKCVSPRWRRAQHPRLILMFISTPFTETSRTLSLTWYGFKASTLF